MDSYGTSSAADVPVDDVAQETEPVAATKQQKLIKAGLLFLLAAIVVYVVLDYTVRRSKP